MPRRFQLLSSLALSFSIACSSEPPVRALSPEAQAVRIETADPPPGAQLLGPVAATDGSGCGIGGERGSLQNARGLLKELAVRKGANFVKVTKLKTPYSGHDCYHQEYSVEGLGYRVHGAAPIARGSASAKAAAASSGVPATITSKAAAPSSEPTACTPACAPGYVCQASVCIAECEPRCGALQVCRADRVCVPAPAP